MKPKGDKKRITWYAPAQRVDKGEILKQHLYFKENSLLVKILESISMATLILNEQRQLVFANKAFMNMIVDIDVTSVLGLRVGEALGCVYSDNMDGGCGTSEHCKECGAVRAIMNSLENEEDVQECRIRLKDSNEALDLRVTASHLMHKDESFVLYSIADIADEKRKEVLERIFLHDVKNTAGILHGFTNLFMEKPASDSSLSMIKELSDKLLDEIDSYQQLIQAESKQLRVNPGELYTHDLLTKVKNQYMGHNPASGKSIEVDSRSEDIIMFSDEIILSRVLGNMTKNALEAIKDGELVLLSSLKIGDRVRFEVHNPGIIPRNVQLQIFQRSFSTKGIGRGLGTYSIKMLSEEFLRGEVGFTSSEDKGTVFYCELPLRLNY